MITTVLLHELEQIDEIAGDRAATFGRLGYLAWLLSKGLLDIKLAVHQDPYQRGIYHEKLGIFRDEDDNVVVFTGSANESVSGLIDNFECVDVLRSWRSGDDDRIAEKIKDFERLWNNQTPTLEILEFPEAARRSLLRLCPDQFPVFELATKSREAQGDYSTPAEVPSFYPILPAWLSLRSYQQQAIANWFANQGRGTLKMTTGSGKTITALAIAAQLYCKSAEQNKPLQGLLIEQIRKGVINRNQIYLSPELIQTFLKYWNHLGSPVHNPDISRPFFYMKSGKFWHLWANSGYEKIVFSKTKLKKFSEVQRTVTYAYLDEGLFKFLQKPLARASLVTVLVARWFPGQFDLIESIFNNIEF